MLPYEKQISYVELCYSCFIIITNHVSYFPCLIFLRYNQHLQEELSYMLTYLCDGEDLVK